MLKDKVALITGGGRGIGRAIALAYARAGADIVLVSRTRSELEKVAAEVEETGQKSLIIEADVSKPEDVARMVADSLDAFGRIDILVNNAGIALPNTVLETSLEDWQTTMAVNMTGVFLCSQAVFKHMVDRRQGKIINISSGSGVRGSAGNAAYSASKAGVVAFTEALAGEAWAAGIRANVICPGPIKTDMVALRPDTGPADEANFLETEDVAGTALFLASDLSGQINAQIFLVRNSNRW
jgi:3-oxoacyl-[acyl-carrier protein] reductase